MVGWQQRLKVEDVINETTYVSSAAGERDADGGPILRRHDVCRSRDGLV